MTLQNLAKIGRVHPHEPTAGEIARLLGAAQRALKDAALAANSLETRFDCAYKALMQCALAGMLANGYRPSTSAPGHQQTMIQSLPLTLGVPSETWVVLDGLRKKRNQADYTGALITEPEAAEAITQAHALLGALRDHLRTRHPHLIE
jgi:uncharacterized protein (UPF0332 family)